MSNNTSTINPLFANPLSAIVEATGRTFRADPAQADAVFTATGQGTGRVSSTIRVGKYTVDVDEPGALGDDAAPNPVEYALAALLSCQVVTYRVWATKLGIDLTDIDLSADGDLDFNGFFGFGAQTRPGFSAVRVAAHLSGPETPERYAELQQAVDAHCPVLDLFSNPTPVHTTITVN